MSSWVGFPIVFPIYTIKYDDVYKKLSVLHILPLIYSISIYYAFSKIFFIEGERQIKNVKNSSYDIAKLALSFSPRLIWYIGTNILELAFPWFVAVFLSLLL